MSSSHVSGFIATIMSTPPRRPRWPLSLILTSYQVGMPWMFEGKILRELAGMPIRRIDLANSELALAEPDPLTLANLTTKSLTLVIAGGIRSELVRVSCHPREACPWQGTGGGGPGGCSGVVGTMTAVIGCGMRVRPLSYR